MTPGNTKNAPVSVKKIRNHEFPAHGSRGPGTVSRTARELQSLTPYFDFTQRPGTKIPTAGDEE